jgi:hypothetical protein
MGFYYDKHSDQDRMINKFDKVAKRNKNVIDENHPDFEPTSLSLAEQFKYWDRKNEAERIKRDAAKAAEETKTTETFISHYKPKS